MGVIAWDTETSLIRAGQLAPKLACVTYASPGTPAEIVGSEDSLDMVSAWLDEPSVQLVGHNVAYDFAVLCAARPLLTRKVFAAYEADRVTDTMIRQQLLDVAAGVYRRAVNSEGKRVQHRYDLESLARRHTGMVLVKDAWRLSYGAFVGVPLSGWLDTAKAVQAAARARVATLDPDHEEYAGLVSLVESDPSQCMTYPLDDARATLAVYQAQEAHVSFLADQYRQARAAWALHLSSVWGIRTDLAGVDVLRRETLAEIESLEADLLEAGLIRPNGSRDTKVAKARMIAVCKAAGRPIVRTDTHKKDCPEDCDHVCLDGDACEASEDPLLEAYAAISTAKKVLANDIEAMSKGVAYPLHTRYGFAATGRTTSSKPNLQNQSNRAGLREAFVPRPGKVFAECDYPQLELYTLAQCCVSWLGQSKLAETLLSGKDPHLVVAATIVGCSYDEALRRIKDPDVKRARKFAKIANFGFPGGLGLESTVAFARKSMGLHEFNALRFDVAAAKRLKEQWYAALPEMPRYFARVNALCDSEDGTANVETLFTKRMRGGASYCATCNNGFQALGSDCAKHAAWLIAKAQYTDPSSALYGTRTVAFVHDEFIIEADEATAHEAAIALGRVMAAGANQYLPDVPIAPEKMQPLLMRRWSKSAESVYRNNRLVPWEPK